MDSYQNQNLFTSVIEERGLEYEKIQMNGRWVSEALQATMKTWDCLLPGLRQPVLINAPTGSGKSTFSLQ